MPAFDYSCQNNNSWFLREQVMERSMVTGFRRENITNVQTLIGAVITLPLSISLLQLL